MRNICDAAGRLKFQVYDESDRNVRICDATGKLLYSYNKATRQTFDANGKLVMNGCILPELE